MANVTVSQTIANEGSDYFWDIGVLAMVAPTIAATNSIVWHIPSDDGPDTLVTLIGTFSNFVNGMPTTGQIIEFHVVNENELQITELNASLANFLAAVNANDALIVQTEWFGEVDFFDLSAGNDIFAGHGGDDYMNGQAGADRLSGRDGDDTLTGGSGIDALYGSDGADTLYGGTEDDVLFGGKGADGLYGGAGNDLLMAVSGIGSALNSPATSWSFGALVTDAAADILDGGLGFDYASLFYLFQTGGFTVDISNPNVTFTILRDGAAFGSITGVEGMNIVGGLGNDLFIGGATNDILAGSTGDDVLIGNAGVDNLTGGEGNDTLTGGAGNDVLNGAAGVDTAIFSGLRANYTINVNANTGQAQVIDTRGGSPDGADTLLNVEYLQFSDMTITTLLAARVQTGDGSANSFTGSAFSDFLSGLGGDDTLYGGDLDDHIAGGDGVDTLYGGAGNDSIDGGAGNEVIDGGLGNDNIAAGSGNDTVVGGGGADTITGELGDDTLTGDGTLTGSLGDDVLTDAAGGLAAILDGGPGNDTLNGDGAATTIHYGNAAGNVTVDLRITTGQNTGDGVDTIVNAWNVNGGGYDDLVTGSGNANIINGGAGDDVLLGLGGDDVLHGNFGDDIIDGGDGNDTASFSTITTGVEVDLGLQGRQLSSPSTGFDTFISIENIIGSTGWDILDGTEGDNVLTGLAGNDDLDGNGGDDILNGGAGDDGLNGGMGTDTAVFSGVMSLYDINLNLDGSYTVMSAAEGIDTLTGIQVLQFADQSVVIAPEEGVVLDASPGNFFHSHFGLAAYAAGAIIHADSETIVVQTSATEIYTLEGNFDISGGVPVGGEINRIQREGSPEAFILGQLQLDLVQFNALAAAGDEAGFRAAVLSANSVTFASLGDDILIANPGDDLVFDQYGSDTMVYSGAFAAYTISIGPGVGAGDVLTVTGPDGHDVLTGIEHLKFADGVTVHLPGHGAIVTVAGGSEDFRWEGLSDLLAAPVLSHDRLSVVLDTTDDEGPNSVTLLGEFTAFDANGFPTAGQVTGLTSEDNGGYLMTITGVSMDVAVFTALLAANDPLALQADWFSGDDTFTGGNDIEPDVLPGGDGNDVLMGGTGNDSLYGGEGDDNLQGQDGGDTLYGAFGYDLLNGNDGNDVLFGGRGFDALYGGAGMDLLAGGFGIGSLTSTSPTWTFGSYVGEASPDVLDGGADFDQALFYFLLESASYTVNIFDSGAVNAVLRDGVGFGSVTNVEQLWAQGGFGNDSFTGGFNNDTLLGGAGNDILAGNAGVDSLNGESGDDVLNGSYGNDNLFGGTGLDTAVFSGVRASYNIGINAVTGLASVTDTRPGADGVDTLTSIELLQFSDGVYNLLSTVQTGTSVGNTLTGAANADVLIGLGGGDTLNGNDGDDSLNGGADNDFLFGGNGNDTIDGGLGSDTIVGGAGNDTINGGDDNDTIADSGSVSDVLNGEAGNDVVTGDGLLFGSLGDDVLQDVVNGFAGTLDGGPGNDTLIGDNVLTIASYSLAGDAVQVDLRISGVAQNTGGGGLDTLTSIRNVTGSGYDDVLIGDDFANSFQAGNGADVLIGNGGNDTLNGLYGDDVLDGGSGNDTASWSGLLTGVQVDLEIQNQPQFTGSGGFDTLISIENLTGTSVNDQLRGDVGANILRGLQGDDFLFGDNGDDTLIGDPGNDVLDGDEGIDTASYAFDVAGVSVTLATQGTGQNTVGSGFDTLNSIENLTGSNFGDTLTGDAGANVISGLGATDVIYGGDGDDTLLGGAGIDSLFGGAGIDTASYAGETSAVFIGVNQVNMGGDTLAGIENLIGTNFNDTLAGDGANNVLTGGLGNDFLHGNGGIDTAVFSGLRSAYSITATSTGITVSGIDGTDTLFGVEFLQFGDQTVAAPPLAVDGTAGNDILGGTPGDDTLNGLDGRDTLYGHDGADTLDGGLQGDQISGGDGSDVIRGGDGDDLVSGARISFLALGAYNLMSNDYAPDIIDGGNGNDLMIIDLIGEQVGYTVNVSNPSSVTGILKGGLTWGTVVNVEGLLGRGGQAGDSLTGGTMNDNFGGQAGNDVLSGLGGADILAGDGGDDTLNGGIGNDNLNGGGGVDTAVFSGTFASYVITINGGPSSLTVVGPDGTDTLLNIEYLQFSDVTITAPNFAMVQVGSGTLNGGAGDDLLIGQAGADTLNGGEGRNSLSGEGGDDTINAGAGIDSIDGGDGNDVINAGGGVDVVYGGQGDDTIDGGADGDSLIADGGNDIVTGDGGNMYGGFGDDKLTDKAGGLAAFIEGGPGDDRIIGDGNTTAGYTLAGHGVAVDLNITTAQDTDGGGIDTLTGVRHLFGSSNDDELTGNALDNTLNGNSGNDLLVGNDGNDTLIGGSATNLLYGGQGSDTASYALTNSFQPAANVDLRISGAQFTGIGTDTLVSIENLTGGSNNDGLIGDDNANVLNGAGGNDGLNGLGGDDTLIGGVGNDAMIGGAGADTAVFSGARSTYTVSDLGGGVTQLVSTADGTDTTTGVETFRFSDGDYSLAGIIGGGSLPTKPQFFAPPGEPIGPNAFVSGVSSPNAVVTVYADGVVIGTATTYGPGFWTASPLDVSGLTDGPHTLTAIATNSVGSSPVSSTLSVIVDSLPPEAPTITTEGGPTSDNTILLEGVTEAGAYIQVFKNSYPGPSLVGVEVDNTGHWSVELPALDDGEYDLIVMATDRAWNQSSLATISVSVVTTTPEAPVIITADSTIGDDEITVTGTAGADLFIDIYVDGVLTAETTSDASGDWTVLVDALEEGAVEITAVARNGAGLTSDASDALDLVVDLTGPEVEVLTVQEWTAHSHLIVSGTAEPGATIALFDQDGNPWNNPVTAGPSGAWTVSADQDLPDGDYQLTVVATDAVGNQTLGEVITVTLDRTAPDAPVITSQVGVIQQGEYLLTGTVEPGAGVSVLMFGGVIAQVMADEAGNWSVDLSGLAEGGYPLSAESFDKAGNYGGSVAFSLLVAPEAPALAVTQTLANDTGASATDHVTRDGHLVIDVATVAGTTVKVFDNGVEIGSKLVGASGVWQFKPNLGAGEHNITVTATKGTAIAYSDPLDAITVDNAGPALSLTSQVLDADTGVSAIDRITSDGHVTVTGTAETGSTVSLYDGVVLVGETVVDASGEWTFHTDLAEGSHRFQAKATDLAGNVTTGGLQPAIVVDKTANAAAITSQTLFADTGASASDNVTSNGKVTLSGAGEAGQVVSIYDGVVKLGQATVTTGGTWSFTATLAEGVHTLTGEAADKAGNITLLAAQAPITVDKTLPVSITIDPVVAFTNDVTPTLNGQTSEADGAITILRDGVAVDQVTADGSGHWTYTSGDLADAKYVYTARVTDLAGNAKTSAAASVTVDTAGPAAPVVASVSSDTGVSSTDGLTKDNTLLVKGTAEAGASVALYQDGVQVGVVAANATTGVWSFNYGTTALADGGYDLTAIATDKAGNVSGLSSALHVVIDTLAPTGTSIGVAANGSAIAANGFTNATALTLSGAAEAGASVAVSAGALGVIGTVIADGSGHWTLDYNAVTTGKLSFSARTTDDAGNTSGAVSHAVNIDLVAPSPQVASIASAGAFTTFAGSSEAGSLVRVFDGATLLGTVTANSAGAWTLKTAKLNDTVHTITLSSTDKAGNVGGSPGVGLVGTTVADTLTAGAGRDLVLGGAGNDRLDGGAGSDQINGGAGSDTFVFAANQAQGDVVLDFFTGLDHLEFSGFNTATASLTNLGSGLWQVSDGVVTETLTIQGAVGAGDWVFV